MCHGKKTKKWVGEHHKNAIPYSRREKHKMAYDDSYDQYSNNKFNN